MNYVHTALAVNIGGNFVDFWVRADAVFVRGKRSTFTQPCMWCVGLPLEFFGIRQIWQNPWRETHACRCPRVGTAPLGAVS